MASTATSYEQLIDDLLRKHTVLTKKLKSVCHRNGREINPARSAKSIHQLGKNLEKIAILYNSSENRQQKNLAKLSWVRSAVLLNAAIVRKPDNVEEIKKDLHELCKKLCRLSGALNKDADLVAKAKLLFCKISKMRVFVSSKLEELIQVGQNRDQEWARKIEELQNEITCQYTECMHDIMKYCVQVMGDPPCKYALVGMGSLARKEITPFSDFENIVILEEGIQDMPGYDNKLEYFRWTTTLFQVIMVNMGETIIRFANIPGLNNPYDKQEDWFYDAHTPCGISPDGFAPYACKNPLGRQEWTKSKPWSTELIKPISEMLKYLNTEQALKNGYHLADVLTKTCFVFGSQELYEDFACKVLRFLSSNKQSIMNILEDVHNLKLANNCLDKTTNTYDLKKLAYRAMSQYMLAIAYFAKLPSITAFDIAHDLAKAKNVRISVTDVESLVLAAATACEIRLRLYMESRGQEDVIVTQNDVKGFKIKRSSAQDTSNECLTNSITTDNLVDFFKTLEIMRRLVTNLINKPDQNVVEINLQSHPSDEAVVECFGMSDKIIQFYNKQLQLIKENPTSTNKEKGEIDWLHDNLAFQFFKKGDIYQAHHHTKARLCQYERLNVERFMPHMAYSMYFDKNDEFIQDIKALQKNDLRDKAKILEFLTLLWETVNSILNNFQMEIMKPYKQFVKQVYMQISGNVLEEQTTFPDINIHTRIQKTSDITLRCLQFANDNTKHYKQAEYDNALRLMKRVWQFYKCENIEIEDLNAMNVLNEEAMQRYDMKQVVYNVMTSHTFRHFMEKLGLEPKLETVLPSAECFCQIEFMQTNYSNALKLYKLLEIFTCWFVDSQNHKSNENRIMVDTLHQIARCLILLKYEGAMDYLKQEITFRKQISDNSKEDAAIARCYFSRALCSLKNMNKCKKYLDCAKVVWENADPVKWNRSITVSTVLLKSLNLMSKHKPSDMLTELNQIEENAYKNQRNGHYMEELDNVHEQFIQFAEIMRKENNYMGALVCYHIARILYIYLSGIPMNNVVINLNKKICSCLQCFEVQDDLD